MARLALILPLMLLPALCGCDAAASSSGSWPPAAGSNVATVAAEPGADRRQLAAALDGLFDRPVELDTRAVIVMRGGRIVAERYAPGYGSQTRFAGWSLAKTVTGVVIGMLIADGRLRLDQPAPVPAWQRPGDPRGEITLRQLLQMRSGLRNAENAEPPFRSDPARMLFLDGRDDMAAYAEAQPLETEPGRTFAYATATTMILADIATRALTASPVPEQRRAAMDEFLRSRLFEPLGLPSMVAEYDAAGTQVGGSMVHGSARDWARFGEFLRQRGAVRGAQLLPRGWFGFMTRPSPRNPAYGAQLWLNRQGADGETGKLSFREAPAGLFGAVGEFGQYVIVSPRQDLVIVRLGHTPDERRAELARALDHLVGLFPLR